MKCSYMTKRANFENYWVEKKERADLLRRKIGRKYAFATS